MIRKVKKAKVDTLEELFKLKVITSGEIFGQLGAKLTAKVKKASFEDPDLAYLYGQLYEAFANRRSVLLFNLQSQV